ncbi:hypothetical protein D3C80_1586940 [compost metagenome]
MLIRTPEQDSGLMPSVFGESAGFRMKTLSIVTLLQTIGLTVQLGELSRVTSFTVTRLHRFRPISVGRGYSSASGCSRCLYHQGAPFPCSVPLPVMDTFTASSA